MAINYPYDPSQLTEGETLYEELIKIRRYLNLNPIYKVYYINTAFVKGTFEYDYSLIVLSEGQEVSQNDVVIFNNYYFATVNSVEKLQDKTIITVTNVHLFALTGPQGPKGDKGEKGDQGVPGDGSSVYVANIKKSRVDFTIDPQTQLDLLESDIIENRNAIAQNVDGIAHVEQIKQNKLSQVDLDNIASIPQKASKAEVTELASQVNTNTNKLNEFKNELYEKNTSKYKLLNSHTYFISIRDSSVEIKYDDGTSAYTLNQGNLYRIDILDNYLFINGIMYHKDWRSGPFYIQGFSTDGIFITDIQRTRSGH